MKLDQVGSFLRPDSLKLARADFQAGKISAHQLRQIEDAAISSCLKAQDAAGLYYLSDGEFRRSWWHLDFYWGLNGIAKIIKDKGYNFVGITTRAEGIAITGAIDAQAHPFIADFVRTAELADAAGLDTSRLKLTIPSPSMLLFMLFIRGGFNTEFAFYGSDYERLKADILGAYAQFYEQFYQAGGAYLQLDDTSFGSFCDAKFCATLSERGLKSAELAEQYVDFLNASLASLNSAITSAIHICRGNYCSHFSASGGYETVAKALFGGLKVDKFFLEFDSERAGGFEPLRYLNGQCAVLGLLSTKAPASPSESELASRAQAAREQIISLGGKGRLEISTQCGFSSTEEGNKLSESEQWAKINLLAKVNERLDSQGFFAGF